MNTALTIAGSDSSGGAGVQADLKTFTVLGVYGMSVLTAITAQNTTGVREALLLSPSLIAAQLDAVAEDFPINAAKTGMLGNAAIITAVADGLRKHPVERYVCDPVIYAKSGAQLLDLNAIHALRQELLPFAAIVTPNRAEAALLANMSLDEVTTLGGAKRAAEKIMRFGCQSVIIKAINTGNTMTDLFYDGHDFVSYPAKRISTKNTHGSGCTFSAILTALLAQDIPLVTALDNARSFISNAIEHHVRLGEGTRPVNPLALTPQ